MVRLQTWHSRSTFIQRNFINIDRSYSQIFEEDDLDLGAKGDKPTNGDGGLLNLILGNSCRYRFSVLSVSEKKMDLKTIQTPMSLLTVYWRPILTCRYFGDYYPMYFYKQQFVYNVFQRLLFWKHLAQFSPHPSV